MNRPVYLQGPAFSVGYVRPLETLHATEEVSEATLCELASRGVSVYCESSREVADMCVDAAAQSLTKAGLNPSDVRGLVFANAMPAMDAKQEIALLTHLHDFGIRVDTVVALQFVHCSAFAPAIEAAADLIRSKSKDNILVLLCNHVTPGVGRLQKELGTVLGDGAAACIVSTRQWGFELVGAETHTDLSLLPSSGGIHPSIQKLRAFQNLRSVAKSVLAKAAITSEELSLLFSTYASQIYLKTTAGAVGVSIHKLLCDPMNKYGHVSACDNIISLAASIDEHARLQRGDYVMTVGWSPHVIGITLLKNVGPMP
jgi:3-oxoacyl-[acyl-carrier-protein] synthase-3